MTRRDEAAEEKTNSKQRRLRLEMFFLAQIRMCKLHLYSRVVFAKLLSLKGKILQTSLLCFSLYQGGCFCFSSPPQPLSHVVFFLLKWSPACCWRPLDTSFVAFQTASSFSKWKRTWLPLWTSAYPCQGPV